MMIRCFIWIYAKEVNRSSWQVDRGVVKKSFAIIVIIYYHAIVHILMLSIQAFDQSTPELSKSLDDLISNLDSKEQW